MEGAACASGAEQTREARMTIAAATGAIAAPATESRKRRKPLAAVFCSEVLVETHACKLALAARASPALAVELPPLRNNVLPEDGPRAAAAHAPGRCRMARSTQCAGLCTERFKNVNAVRRRSHTRLQTGAASRAREVLGVEGEALDGDESTFSDFAAAATARRRGCRAALNTDGLVARSDKRTGYRFSAEGAHEAGRVVGLRRSCDILARPQWHLAIATATC